LKNFKFCEDKFATKYSFVVAEAFRTQRKISVPETDAIRLYVLFADAMITNDKDSATKNTKVMYLLHCTKQNHQHLKS
jgi:hypothetical protein